MTSSEATEDLFHGGRVTVRQPKRGFRAGTDSVFLAAAIDATPGGRVLEVGCGAGAALFCAAARLPGVQFTGIDIDVAMIELARQGVAANEFGQRVEIQECDAGDMPGDWENRFDAVFSNPPFFEPGEITAPGEGKQHAYLSDIGLEAWLKAMIFAAKPRAPITLIHRAAELARILAALERRAGEIVILPIRARPGDEAKRVLVRARKGLRPGPTRLLAGMDLMQKNSDSPCVVAATVLSGEALEWR